MLELANRCRVNLQRLRSVLERINSEVGNISENTTKRTTTHKQTMINVGTFSRLTKDPLVCLRAQYSEMSSKLKLGPQNVKYLLWCHDLGRLTDKIKR